MHEAWRIHTSCARCCKNRLLQMVQWSSRFRSLRQYRRCCRRFIEGKTTAARRSIECHSEPLQPVALKEKGYEDITPHALFYFSKPPWHSLNALHPSHGVYFRSPFPTPAPHPPVIFNPSPPATP